MRARIPASLATLAAATTLMIGSPAGASDSTPQPVARGGLVSCGVLSFRGRHQLAQRNLGCGTAKQRAIYVIKRDKAPPGWTCSGSPIKGKATCRSGRKVFAISRL